MRVFLILIFSTFILNSAYLQSCFSDPFLSDPVMLPNPVIEDMEFEFGITFGDNLGDIENPEEELLKIVITVLGTDLVEDSLLYVTGDMSYFDWEYNENLSTIIGTLNRELKFGKTLDLKFRGIVNNLNMCARELIGFNANISPISCMIFTNQGENDAVNIFTGCKSRAVVEFDESVEISEGESLNSATFCLSESFDEDVIIEWQFLAEESTATSEDIMAVSGHTTIAVGETCAQLNLEIIDDSDFEPSELLTLQIRTSENAKLVKDIMFVHIHNDDAECPIQKPTVALTRQ